MSRLSRPPARLAAPPRAVGYADRAEAERARDRIRSGEREARRLYNTARWRRLRLEILERDNWTCQQTGELLIGERHAPNSPVVDHIRPHRGNLALFWNPDNLQAVTKAYHDSTKQRIERAAILALGPAGGGSDP